MAVEQIEKPYTEFKLKCDKCGCSVKKQSSDLHSLIASQETEDKWHIRVLSHWMSGFVKPPVDLEIQCLCRACKDEVLNAWLEQLRWANELQLEG